MNNNPLSTLQKFASYLKYRTHSAITGMAKPVVVNAEKITSCKFNLKK